MIYLATTFIDYQVITISTLQPVGQVNGILINPLQFSVAGFWIEGQPHSQNRPVILLSKSLRQIDTGRVFINDINDLNKPQDLPKLKSILKIDYQIPGKKVVSTNQEYLGRAEDFSFDEDSFKIMHILIKAPFYQRLRRNRQQFTRTQIEKIDAKLIEVNIEPQPEKLQPIPSNIIS